MAYRTEDKYWRKMKGDRLPEFFRSIGTDGRLDAERVAFVCIGTDRSTGDALGPLVGTMLQEAGCPHVIGTLEHPCDASNLGERLAEIPAGATVVAIDACLGQPASVGLFQVSNQPLVPGKSVGKALPVVGDYAVAAIVNADGPRQIHILQSTSLHHVLTMARQLAAAIAAAMRRGG
ncbi:sporulation protein [Gordoniibacillus kamchatkensis]|uniref:Sporulation protein n=1 Tax=Gordoniibacillus kamchatkensis TaxID=1590651 RepID=A0ABR5AG32_9BACL|nr:spore protease YyaC [Paenibacillus sp. VKM B-2647]KIL39999.1 sporulation protein [Paenibacillus sp. VKM B-2647]